MVKFLHFTYRSSNIWRHRSKGCISTSWRGATQAISPPLKLSLIVLILLAGDLTRATRLGKKTGLSLSDATQASKARIIQGSAKRQPSTQTPALGVEETIYSYDWTFGITLIEGFYWDWRKELPDESALAIHLVLKPEPPKMGLKRSQLGPSSVRCILQEIQRVFGSRPCRWYRRQRLKWPKPAHQLSAPELSLQWLMLGSNVLASYADNQKNCSCINFLMRSRNVRLSSGESTKRFWSNMDRSSAARCF